MSTSVNIQPPKGEDLSITTRVTEWDSERPGLRYTSITITTGGDEVVFYLHHGALDLLDSMASQFRSIRRELADALIEAEGTDQRYTSAEAGSHWQAGEER